ncbi:MAG: SPASM domain-containing protein, partial [Phycisphaerae bacterium]|nr:SPASM domain-containing protein [Phycisphaerae bacterium]
LTMTTNGTITHAQAWSIMTLPDLSLAISFDGLPAVHDRHRCFRNGRGTAGVVEGTIRRLVGAGKPFRVAMVVRPDTLEHLPESLLYLRRLGVRRIEPSLDVWATWTEADIDRLEAIVAECATLWRDGLPHWSIGWFDQKAVELANLPHKRPLRCGFGDGELTVTPAGRMYPCERLVGDDVVGNPMALPGNVMDGEDFINMPKSPGRTDEACGACAMVGMCNTFCRCSNYVRTGDVRKPDALLCRWNQVCLAETSRVLREAAPAAPRNRMENNQPACAPT